MKETAAGNQRQYYELQVPSYEKKAPGALTSTRRLLAII
jgi:hypothetical protein